MLYMSLIARHLTLLEFMYLYNQKINCIHMNFNFIHVLKSTVHQFSLVSDSDKSTFKCLADEISEPVPVV